MTDVPCDPFGDRRSADLVPDPDDPDHPKNQAAIQRLTQ